jgi:membrane-associated protease RseP (regulator of RpoE activity)
MERKAWWAAGTLGALVLAGLVTAGIAVSSQAGSSNDDDQIKKKTTVTVVTKGERGAYLGVRTSEDTESDQGGARVNEVMDDSPAEEAGIEEGDVIVSFGGATVRGPMALTEQIHKASPEDKVQVGIVRDGKRQTVAVTLGERAHTTIMVPRHGQYIQVPLPDTEALENHLKGLENFYVGPKGNAWVFRMGNRPKLGVELVETTPELREHLGGGRDRGVLVGKVMSEMPAEKAGLKVGDLIVSVDGDSVSDASELVEALEDKDGKTVALEVVRDGKQMRLSVTLPAEEEDEEVSGPRADLERAREELTAARLARLDALRELRQQVRQALVETQRVQIEAEHAARAAQQDIVRQSRQAQREAMRAEREAMRKAREELRREMVQARGYTLI